MSQDEKPAENHPWSRREGETNRWFQRFESFRLAGVGRSLLSLYVDEWAKRREVAGKSTTPRPKNVSGPWAEKAKVFQWRARADAWDEWLTAQAEAEVEARWRKEIMGRTEILGRMASIGRVNVDDFLVFDENGKITGLNRDTLKEYGWLVKKISTLHGRISIELHDSKGAMEWLGRQLGMVGERMTNMNIDLGSLSDAQLSRLAAGEDLLHVLTNPG